jgi:hypothetical protein
MACPFFLPVRRLDQGAWVHPPRLPLGDPYLGECHADPAGPHEPPEAHQRELCNCGYARFRCSHFPEDAAADAVRFSILKDSDGCTELVYIVEKDHAPAEHGKLTYWMEEDRLDGPHTSDLLTRQARAFLSAGEKRGP